MVFKPKIVKIKPKPVQEVVKKVEEKVEEEQEEQEEQEEEVEEPAIPSVPSKKAVEDKVWVITEVPTETQAVIHNSKTGETLDVLGGITKILNVLEEIEEE